MKNFIRKNLKIIILIVSFLGTIMLGSLTGIILVYQKGFPLIENLEDIRPEVMTTLYDENNRPFKEFAIEKRVILRSSEIPDVFKKALIAAEDHKFYSHWGINFKGIFRAIAGKILGKNWGGGSSITQQLARGFFLSQEYRISRKLKEMLLAIQIEKKYTKDQIITFYCNKVAMGSSAYGLEAASQYYFGKHASELELAEAAMIASVLPNPFSTFNVYREPERVKRRRNYILSQMHTMGSITREEMDAAKAAPLPTRSFDLNKEAIADYFSEEIRKYLEEKYGKNLLYKGGLKVYTTLNREMQEWAIQSLQDGLRNLDKRKGWRIRQKLPNLLEQKKDISTHTIPSWKGFSPKEEMIAEGIVLSVTAKKATVRIDRFQGDLNAKEARWTKYPLQRILKKGDIALFKVLEIDENTSQMKLGLEQEPEIEGAILVVDNNTGAIKAMVGGYSFDKSKWNRAIQALRQPGSTFKPIIYTAALEHGFTPSTLIEDAPFIYIDPATGIPWEPKNNEEDYRGLLTMRRGLELSRNVVTARIIESITPEIGMRYAKRFGISSDLKPYMSIALGALEVTLKEMVEAFSVFANLGTRVNAYYIKGIRDLNNYIIEENLPEKTQVIEKETAFVMNYLLQGVIKSGTGWRARDLPAPIGGKTGTSNDYNDAWFIGFTPTVTVGVWIGYDQLRSLGRGHTGGEAALPIFITFMQKYLEKYPETNKFRPPGSILFVDIDKYTGKRFTPECFPGYFFKEAFIPGTEPGPLDFCNEEEHMRIQGYYKTVETTVDEDGAIR